MSGHAVHLPFRGRVRTIAPLPTEPNMETSAGTSGRLCVLLSRSGQPKKCFVILNRRRRLVDGGARLFLTAPECEGPPPL